MIHKPWFEAIQFFRGRTVLSMILAWFFLRKSAHIRTRTSSSSQRMCLKPGKLFDLPVTVECSHSKRHFVRGWLKRFPWLANSKFLDGAFFLPCVLFGVLSGRNSNKLDKLYKTPLTLWTSAMSRFTKHASGKCEMHNFSLIAMDNFLKNMTRQSVSIDQQISNFLQ